MRVPEGALQGNFRFSLSRYTTDADIDRAVSAFVDVVAAVRYTSSKWDNDKSEPIA
jgi:cysteine desulfurase